MIINLIYSFSFSCFHGIVPGLGTLLEKEVTEYQLDIVASFLFGGTLVEHFGKYLFSAHVEALFPAFPLWYEKRTNHIWIAPSKVLLMVLLTLPVSPVHQRKVSFQPLQLHRLLYLGASFPISA